MREEKLVVFAIPFSGGTSYSYKLLQDALPDHIWMETLELPGHGRRMGEELLTDADEMAADILEQIGDIDASRFAFYGHSLGALIAFLATRELFKSGARGPEHLFVSGRRAPSVRRTCGPRHLLDRDAFREELKSLGGSSSEALENEELMELFEPILRADFEAADGYVHAVGAALPCAITAFVGADDPEATASAAELWWIETSAAFECLEFDGDHFFINAEAGSIASAISTTLSSDLVA